LTLAWRYVSTTGLVLAVACGGGGGGEATRESVESCLREANAEVTTNEDDLYSIADPIWEGEGLVTTIGENDAALAVMRSESDAQRLVSCAELFYEGMDTPSDDVLKWYGSVVVEWSEAPTDEETTTLEGCVP
jgi:hypothetical protein